MEDRPSSVDAALDQALLDKYGADIRNADAQAKLAEIQADNEVMNGRGGRRSLEMYGLEAEIKGEFLFYGDVDEHTVIPLMRRMDAWSKNHPGDPIVLTIMSHGGAVYDGLAFYDFLGSLKRRGHHLTTHCMGAALSMGAILMQAGDHRVIEPSAFLLIHEVGTVVSGQRFSTTATKDLADYQDKLQSVLLERLAARANVSAEEITRRWERVDWLIRANEALALGFVDAVAE